MDHSCTSPVVERHFYLASTSLTWCLFSFIHFITTSLFSNPSFAHSFLVLSKMSTKMFLLVALSALSVVQQADARPVAYHFRRANATSAIGNFGSCTVPQVKFAVGFDNRKETSFEPVDQGRTHSSKFVAFELTLLRSVLQPRQR